MWLAPTCNRRRRLGWRIRSYASTDADEWSGTFCGGDHWVAYAIQSAGRTQIVADSYPVRGHRSVLTHEPIGRPAGSMRTFWVLATAHLRARGRDDATSREAPVSRGQDCRRTTPHTVPDTAGLSRHRAVRGWNRVPGGVASRIQTGATLALILIGSCSRDKP